MTEKEVTDLEAEIIGDRKLDPGMQREWLLARLKDAKQGEQNVMNAFRLHKYLRDEAQMKANKTTIKEIRGAIEFLESELQKLGPESLPVG